MPIAFQTEGANGSHGKHGRSHGQRQKRTQKTSFRRSIVAKTTTNTSKIFKKIVKFQRLKW